MSITASLANATSGLTAASRAAQLVSTNVANAMTEGYARRELELSTRYTGGGSSGVQVDGVRRLVDEFTIRERRLADAEVGFTGSTLEFNEDLLRLVCEPGATGSLTDLQSEFEAALISAVSRPEQSTRLAAVLSAANAVADKLNDIGDGIQTLREDADREIGRQVAHLNNTLNQIQTLNNDIMRLNPASSGYADLLDQRQRLVDGISDLVPLRQFVRDNGTIALYTTNGAALLDGQAAKIAFQPTDPITPDMTAQSGALSRLAINGVFIDAGDPNAPLAGGRLAALFVIRDTQAISAQAAVDDIARDLIARFETPGLDPTLAPGAPGLFTDAGAALNTSNTIGLSTRIHINALVDPSAGGAIWRLRDGLGATSPGSVGEASILSAYANVLSEVRAPTASLLGASAQSASGTGSATSHMRRTSLPSSRRMRRSASSSKHCTITASSRAA